MFLGSNFLKTEMARLQIWTFLHQPKTNSSIIFYYIKKKISGDKPRCIWFKFETIETGVWQGPWLPATLHLVYIVMPFQAHIHLTFVYRNRLRNASLPRLKTESRLSIYTQYRTVVLHVDGRTILWSQMTSWCLQLTGLVWYFVRNVFTISLNFDP